MNYDRRKFLKIGGAAAVGLAVTGSIVATDKTGGSALASTATPTSTPYCKSTPTTLGTPTPGPTCASSCQAGPIPNPTPTPQACPAVGVGQEAVAGDLGNVCLIKETEQIAGYQITQILAMIDGATGCKLADHNRQRLQAMASLLQDASDPSCADDALDVLALLLRKIKIPSQPTRYPRPPGKDQDVNCWLDYISALLDDLFARLQGECNDLQLGNSYASLSTGQSHSAMVSIKASVIYIQGALAYITAHLSQHHFCAVCKNRLLINASKA